MPDPIPLPVTPSSARALAAARPGEEVTVRVPFEREPLWDEEPSRTKVGTWIGRYQDGEMLPDGSGNTWVEVDEHEPPAAVGERVAVECPDCEGQGHWPFEVQATERVTRDMAIAGGDPGLEGTLYSVRQEAGREPCETCQGHGTFPATVVSAPEPEAWCDTCEGALFGVPVTCDCGGTPPCEHYKHKPCPTCHGTPSTWVWRVGVRRES